MRFNIITLFPEIFEPYFNASILGRARKNKLIDIKTFNLRDFVEKDKYKKVDDKPYGGGAGMVMMAEPVLKAVDKILKTSAKKGKTKVIVFSAKGKPFDQKKAYEWSRKFDNFIFINGRYEGIDERVMEILSARGGSAFGGKVEEVSIGPYVLTDGDVAAMVLVSAIARLAPGVIKWESLEEESFFNVLIKKESKSAVGAGLEYPHYTRPETLKWKGKKYAVPKVLLSGNHKEIEKWRLDKRGKSR